jgi:hypothetical protein
MSIGLCNLGCNEQPEEKTTSQLSLRQIHIPFFFFFEYILLNFGLYQTLHKAKSL